DKSIRIWDAVNGGASLRNFHGHMEEVTGVAFHPSGQQVASVSADQTVRLWNLDTVEHHQTLTGHQGPVWSAQFSPDGQRVVSGSADRTLKVWDATSRK